MKKIKITIFLLIPIALSPIVIIGYQLYLKKKEHLHRVDLRALADKTEHIHQLWTRGDFEKKLSNGNLQCPELSPPNKRVLIDDEYWKCNIDFLKCYYRSFKLKTKNKDIIKLDFLKAKIQYHPLKLSLRNSELIIRLAPTCHRSYLPRRTYSYGPYNKFKKDWQWNNYHRNIMIDKFLVNRRDVNYWLEAKNKKNIYQNLWEGDKRKLALPATNLTKKQMKEYCKDHKKQLLQAHIADAAAFHPGNLKNKNPKKIIRAQTPWFPRRGSSFLHKFKKKRNIEIKKSYCQKIYALECLGKFPLHLYSSNNFSWIGVSDLLGHVMESFRNPIHPKKNTSFSSQRLPFNSYWHALGLRGYWDGLDFTHRNFNWWRESPRNVVLDDVKVGFRCMENQY